MISSRGYFRLNNHYDSSTYSDVNNRIAVLYFFGQGTTQDFSEGWDYLTKKYSGYYDTISLFLKSDRLGSNQKSDILNTIENNNTLINQMGKKQMYKLGMLGEDLHDSYREKINELVQVGLGLLYEYGGGVEQDYQKALRCYKNLVGNARKVGFHRLGLMYYYGKGVSVNYKEAPSLFEEDPHGVLMHNGKLASVYSQSGFYTDDTQSNLVFCTMEFVDVKGESLYYLGMMHRNGQGVPQNEEKAREYFELAFVHGCKRALLEIVY